MSAYTYEIEYKPTNEHENADMLSRLPEGPDNYPKPCAVDNLIQDEQLEHSPILAADIQKATKEDNTWRK